MFLKNKSAFTIIETLTVVGIIGIVALISFPVYKAIGPGINLSSTTRDITSDLRYAQQLAVTEQIIYNISFTSSTNSYEIRKSSDNLLIKSRTINNGISIYSITGFTNNTAKFTATGAAVETGSIIIANTKGQQSTIEIKPSGYVKIVN